MPQRVDVSAAQGAAITSLAANATFVFIGTAECQLFSFPLQRLLKRRSPSYAMEPFATFSGHLDTVQSLVCHSPTGGAEDLILSGGGDGTIFVLRAATLDFLGRLQVRRTDFTSV